jgi:hypothetical protein
LSGATLRATSGSTFLDGGTFYLGLSMVSRFTVLPLFVERLSPDRWLQGLIPAINYTGWFLPGLFHCAADCSDAAAQADPVDGDGVRAPAVF